MATEEKAKSSAPSKPFGQTIRETKQKVANITIGNMLGWTKPAAMAVGYLAVPICLAAAAVGYVERDEITSAVEDYARPAIEAQDAKDGRFIPKQTCLRYSMDRGEHITVADSCTGKFSLDFVVIPMLNNTVNSEGITLNVGNYRVESLMIGKELNYTPTISRKVPETYQSVQ